MKYLLMTLVVMLALWGPALMADEDDNPYGDYPPYGCQDEPVWICTPDGCMWVYLDCN